jgi:hypothetical protein
MILSEYINNNFMKNLCSLLACMWLIVACQEDNKKALLFGKWKAVEWVVSGKKSDRDLSSVRFEFKADDSYWATYASERESGAYRFKGDKLYTLAKEGNKIEKMVMLLKLTKDSMIMDMNRVGTSEQLILIKE